MKSKKAFIIIFHRYYFYPLGVILILFFGYSYLLDNEFISDDTYFGDLLQINPQNITLIESEIHRLTNEQRILNGFNALEYKISISSRAREHSNRMADYDFFEHDELVGLEMGENIAYTPIGNVVGCGNVYDETKIAECTVDGLMDSPGHRENILRRRFKCEGIGVAISDNDEVYVTQKFC